MLLISGSYNSQIWYYLMILHFLHWQKMKSCWFVVNLETSRLFPSVSSLSKYSADLGFFPSAFCIPSPLGWWSETQVLLWYLWHLHSDVGFLVVLFLFCLWHSRFCGYLWFLGTWSTCFISDTLGEIIGVFWHFTGEPGSYKVASHPFPCSFCTAKGLPSFWTLLAAEILSASELA